MPDISLKIVKEEGYRKWIIFEKDEISPTDVLAMLGALYKINNFSMQEADIEETVKEIYKKNSL